MHVEFTDGYFGTENGDTSVFDAKLNTQFHDDKFHVNCPLGDCGMVTALNDDDTNIIFTMTISVNDMEKITVNDNGNDLSFFSGNKKFYQSKILIKSHIALNVRYTRHPCVTIIS